jgi:hypothetical protein
LCGKVKFPKDVDRKAYSIICHLLEHDLSKRYGTLFNGISDIKNHRFFNGINWDLL